MIDSAAYSIVTQLLHQPTAAFGKRDGAAEYFSFLSLASNPNS